jgi:hypothetical protein
MAQVLRKPIAHQQMSTDEPFASAAAGASVLVIAGSMRIVLTPEAALETARGLERSAAAAIRDRRIEAAMGR